MLITVYTGTCRVLHRANSRRGKTKFLVLVPPLRSRPWIHVYTLSVSVMELVMCSLSSCLNYIVMYSDLNLTETCLIWCSQ